LIEKKIFVRNLASVEKEMDFKLWFLQIIEEFSTICFAGASD